MVRKKHLKQGEGKIMLSSEQRVLRHVYFYHSVLCGHEIAKDYMSIFTISFDACHAMFSVFHPSIFHCTRENSKLSLLPRCIVSLLPKHVGWDLVHVAMLSPTTANAALHVFSRCDGRRARSVPPFVSTTFTSTCTRDVHGCVVVATTSHHVAFLAWSMHGRGS